MSAGEWVKWCAAGAAAVALASAPTAGAPAPSEAEMWTIVARPGQPAANVEDLGVMVSVGRAGENRSLGPSTDGSGLSIYTFAQRGHSVDQLVEINLQNKQVTTYDPKMTGDPWRQMWGKDGKWYYGAEQFLAFDPKARKVEDLGVPPQNWRTVMVHSLVWGPDNRIWIGLCTGGGLACFDPATKRWEDYGQVGPPPPPKMPHYAEILGFDDGWVMVHRRNLPIVLAAVNMKTKQMNTLFLQEKEGQSYQLRWIDEQAYVTVTDRDAGGKATTGLFAVQEGQLKPVSAFPAGSDQIRSWGRPANSIPAGALPPGGALPKILVGPVEPAQPTRMVAWWQFPGGAWQKAEFAAPPSPERLFRIKTMPDGRILGATYDLRVMCTYDPATGRRETLGTVSQGYNVYDMAFQAGKVYMIGYAGAALFEYDPSRPWSRDRTDPNLPSSRGPNEPPRDNPRAVGTLSMKHGHELLAGVDGCIYMRAYPTRDDVGGGFGWYDPATQKTTRIRDPFKVLALTGLTPVMGGKQIAIGTRVDPDPLKRTPTPPAARIFLFDTEKKAIIRDAEFLPQQLTTGRLIEVEPGVLLSVLPDTQQGTTRLCFFDTEKMAVVRQATLPGLLSDPERGPDGALWAFFAEKPMRDGERITGFADDRLVRLDVRGKRIEPVTALPRCRFTFAGRDLYFIREPAEPESPHLFRVKAVAPGAR